MHGLRHTHASVLLYKKVSIYYVSERLGHSDIETTLKEYTHEVKELRVEDERATMKTFEEMVV
jgi:integrase